MGARISGIAAAALAFALVGLLSGCAEPKLHVDIKNVAKQLDAGSISEVVCTQEYGPTNPLSDVAYHYVIAISGSDKSDAVIAQLEKQNFAEDSAQSRPGASTLYDPHREIQVEVISIPKDKDSVNLGGGPCKVPDGGLTEISFS